MLTTSINIFGRQIGKKKKTNIEINNKARINNQRHEHFFLSFVAMTFIPMYIVKQIR